MNYFKKSHLMTKAEEKDLTDSLHIMLCCVCCYDQNEINKKNVFLVLSSSFQLNPQRRS